jgi:molybdopterin-binding protein
MKISARNVLKGKVKSVIEGAINAEVVIELKGGETVTSIISMSSLKTLEIKEGKEVYGIVKASNVMIAVD